VARFRVKAFVLMALLMLQCHESAEVAGLELLLLETPDT
jgi:hypothetical protein